MGLQLQTFEISFTCRVRTSSGTFLTRGRDKIVQNIEKRIADFAFIPVGMWLRHSSLFFAAMGRHTLDFLNEHFKVFWVFLELPCWYLRTFVS